MARSLIILHALLFLSLASDAGARPNVLVLLTDDQGLGDFSSSGNPVLQTPHLNRLRGESIRLTDFHVTPMCTPTRGQLLTGVDAVRNGATSVTGGRSFIRQGFRTAPELFASAGYRTGLFGKWHLGDHFPHRPGDRGFQTAVHHLGWGFTSAPEFANSLFDGRLRRNGTEEKFSGHCTDVWFEEAIHWMRASGKKGEPFFCYLATNAPHTPHIVAEKYSAPYAGRGPAEFFGMIAQIDRNVGLLEAFLKESGLRENTIVVFATDNGGTAGVKLFNAGLREGKTTYYDGGHRVPCWVRWPAGKLGKPRDIHEPTQMQDVLPTLLDFAGVPTDAKFDGVSLAARMRGKSGPVTERTFVVQYSRARLAKWECCVVSGKWRLVNGTALYDVELDRAQVRDLADVHPETVERLRSHYEKWWAGVEPCINEWVPCATVGSDKQTLTELTSADWQDAYVDNSNHIRAAEGGPRGSHWNIRAERAGTYRVTLRRWPRELDLPLDAAMPAPATEKGKCTLGKGLPISRAVITVGTREFSAKAESDAKTIVIEADFSAGETRLQAWFQDDKGSDLCGAFFADIERVK